MIGIVHIEDETFITDRNNSDGVLVERVELRPTWDIDRAGSKGQVSVTADAGVLEAGMWLSTYRTITPERGEIIRSPRGHWHLSRPGISYPGGHELDTGNVAVLQTASGSDIVDDISGVLLTDAFYTPRNGHVMTDVQVLIKMATAGILGPNLVANGSFENQGTNWNGPAWVSGGTGTFDWTAPTVDIPDGKRLFRTLFNTSNPAGGTGYVYTDLIAIPPGAQYLAMSGVHRSGSNTRMFMSMRFHKEDGSGISGTTVDSVPSGTATSPSAWYRQFVAVPVPAGAYYVRLWVFAVDLIGGRDNHVMWDDIQLRTATMMPLPDDRINLPLSDLTASTRIQTVQGKSIGYDAINADRLNAIGHNAIATDMDGRLTTQPIRTLANATAKYTFGPGDIELLDVVAPEISAITEKPFNHWRAVKEDFQDASSSMAADSYNNNPNDPFSVVNSGSVHSAPLITVQDAVSSSALQTMANAARDRYSLSETARFAIMPLPDITVYDIVAIEDPDMPEINGLWAVNSIDASGDYLVVTATRAVSREL